VRPIDAARAYVARGWLVIPCHDLSTGACSCLSEHCSSPGKHPRVERGLHAATTDPALVDRWWTRWPTASVGVRTGSESGLVVLDIDPRHGGSRTIKSLIDRHGDLRDVPRVRTGAGGWHLYFAHPGVPVPNSAGRLGPGLDVRGDGGYVIAPPSGHVSGRSYRWEIEPASLPPLPNWLKDEAARLDRSRASRPARTAALPVPGERSAWARAALENELRAVRMSRPGTRNTTLNRSAFCLGQIVAAGLLDRAMVEHLLIENGLGIGLNEREATMTVHSGLRAGIDHPRGPVAMTRVPTIDRQAEPVEIDLP
jgi:hypothetical protein